MKNRGIVNLRNTCFINSVLQCIIKIKPINEYFRENLTEEMLKEVEMNNFLVLFKNFIERFYIFEEPLKPVLLVEECFKLFIGERPHTQQDASEFIYLLFEKLHNEIVGLRKELPPVIEEIFQGKRTFTYKCLTQDRTLESNDLFYQIELPIPPENEEFEMDFDEMSDDKQLIEKKLSSCRYRFYRFFKKQRMFTMNDCLNLNYKTQKVSFCKICGKINSCEVTEKLIELPKYVVICFKRFAFVNKVFKLTNQIFIPRHLDFKKFIDHNSYYTLRSVIQHKGSIRSGHYSAFIKAKKGKWLMFNDTNFREKNWEDVLMAQPYITIYKRSSKKLNNEINSSNLHDEFS